MSENKPTVPHRAATRGSAVPSRRGTRRRARRLPSTESAARGRAHSRPLSRSPRRHLALARGVARDWI